MLTAFFAGRRKLGDANQKEETCLCLQLKRESVYSCYSMVSVSLAACSLPRTAYHRTPRGCSSLFKWGPRLAAAWLPKIVRGRKSPSQDLNQKVQVKLRSLRARPLPGDSWATWSWKTCLQSPFRKAHKLNVPRIWGKWGERHKEPLQALLRSGPEGKEKAVHRKASLLHSPASPSGRWEREGPGRLSPHSQLRRCRYKQRGSCCREKLQEPGRTGQVSYWGRLGL